MAELPERIASKITKTPYCWIWNASTCLPGYGVVFFEGRQQNAHRVVYTIVKGAVPDGLDVDHLCRNKLCVNPDHLEAVTHRENIRRGAGPFAERAQQTHCKRGHPFDAENTRIRSNGTRACKECNRRWSREKYARKVGQHV